MKCGKIFTISAFSKIKKSLVASVLVEEISLLNVRKVLSKSLIAFIWRLRSSRKRHSQILLASSIYCTRSYVLSESLGRKPFRLIRREGRAKLRVDLTKVVCRL